MALFERLKNVLDRYYSKYKEDKVAIPECIWDKDFHFIPRYDKTDNKESEIENNAGVRIKKVTTLNQVQRIVFFAVCKYFDDGEPEEESLKRWMRVVWNLVSGEDGNGHPQIRSTSAMRTAIEFIDKLDSHDVYKSLRDYKDDLATSDFDLRCKEEIEKAKKSLEPEDEKDWEDVIIKAENYAFFHGAIRFLFTDENGNVDWKDFDTKWQSAQKYFDKQGVKSDYSDKALLLRSFIAYIDSFPCDDYGYWNNFHIYCNKNNSNSWRQLLLSNYYKYNSKLLIKCYTIEELGQFISPVDNYKSKYCQEQLVNTLILDNVMDNVRIRWNWGVFTLYPDNTKSENNIYIISNRNNLIASLDNGGDNRQKINSIPFYKGKNINFEFQDCRFQWYGTPNFNEADVYLMDEDWDYLRRNNTEKKDTDKDKFYCIKIDKHETVDSFKEKLIELIKSHN